MDRFIKNGQVESSINAAKLIDISGKLLPEIIVLKKNPTIPLNLNVRQPDW